MTDFDKDASGKDALSYFQRVSYTDADSTSKVITTRSWFDGAGRTLRSGVGQGVSPASYDAVKKRVDARNVETHYKYDSLNRLERVWYTGLGGGDTGAVRPALPAGVEATVDVVLQYNTASPGNGAASRVDDGAGYATCAYDSLGRNTSKSRVIDTYTFTTSYEYNQVGQQTAIIYP
ncbi:MAG: hypothetical protein AB1631_30580 [Acidobacteriota bacterium]